MSSAGAVSAETGGQSLSGEAVFVHSADVAQPTESVDAELVTNWEDVASTADRVMGYVAVRCEADFEYVAETAHLERFQAAGLSDAGGPAFRAIE